MSAKTRPFQRRWRGPAEPDFDKLQSARAVARWENEGGAIRDADGVLKRCSTRAGAKRTHDSANVPVPH
jgi:hypothetical protein